MKELNEIASVNVYSGWKDSEPDPDAWKYRVNRYEDYLTPRTIVNPRYRTLYDPETEPHFTNDNTAMEGLMQKEPSELIQPEKKRLVVLLRARGWTINEICAKVELSKPTVIRTIRKFAEDIKNLNKTELEELVQFYAFTLRKRIETFGKIQGVLMAELETRDAKDIPTDKIIDLIIKCDKAVSDDILAKIAGEAETDNRLEKAGLY